MEAVQNHETEVKELFDKLTAPIPGSNGPRAITLEGFTAAISVMMNKAFFQGQMDAVETTESLFRKVFSKES